jgi:hypothetical protein
MIALHQNETSSSLPYVQSLLSPDLGPAFQVALFFISIFFCHTLTAHFPLPEPPSQGIGRSTSLVLSPVSTSVSSFHSVFCVTKRTRLLVWQLLTLRWPHDHFSNIDPLPLAVRIPVRYRPLVDQNPNVWKPVSKDLPSIDVAGLPLDNNQQPSTCQLRRTLKENAIALSNNTPISPNFKHSSPSSNLATPPGKPTRSTNQCS